MESVVLDVALKNILEPVQILALGVMEALKQQHQWFPYRPQQKVLLMLLQMHLVQPECPEITNVFAVSNLEWII